MIFLSCYLSGNRPLLDDKISLGLFCRLNYINTYFDDEDDNKEVTFVKIGDDEVENQVTRYQNLWKYSCGSKRSVG